MSNENIIKIALLGQPNSGKSTIFNGLTGAKQKVGNWPGKTVEKKEGHFNDDGKKYMIMDLPGSYSLSANSDEEVITREYIASESADLVCILADASQLERSMYMLADYAGIETPALLVLNMSDVAAGKGITVKPDIIQKRLGIPVISFVASDLKNYHQLKTAIKDAVDNPRYVNREKLDEQYIQTAGEPYNHILERIPKEGMDHYSNTWIAAKFMENDELINNKISSSITSDERIDIINTVNSIGNLNVTSGECKFKWINHILDGAVTRKTDSENTLSKFDRAATSRKWGKLISIGIIMGGLVLSMIVAFPIMGIGVTIPSLLNPILSSGLEAVGASEFVINLVEGVLVNALMMTISMLGFVFGILIVFGLIEQVGYMARISYVFDNLMSKLGLQGKAIMPFLVSFGCTIGGVASTRVIDSWGQRLLAITLTWAVPCAATFVVIPPIAAAFFGWGSIPIMLLIFVIAVVHMIITAKIFGRKFSPEGNAVGMIMELPPYHKPKWKALFKSAVSKLWGIFKRAFAIILVVSLVFWLLSYSSTGNPENSALYYIGKAIEPFTKIFGMRWETFLAFISSAISKEAVLGVLSALYLNTGSIFESTIGTVGAAANLTEVLQAQISKPEALAFIFATTFNVPCIAALGSTYQETHSLGKTLMIAGYYILMALLIAFIVYHIASFIF